MIINPAYSGAESEMAEVEAAGRNIGIKSKGDGQDRGPTSIGLRGHRSDCALTLSSVGADGFFITQRQQLAAFATRHAMPGIYPFPDFPAVGGLLSYG